MLSSSPSALKVSVPVSNSSFLLRSDYLRFQFLFPPRSSLFFLSQVPIFFSFKCSFFPLSAPLSSPAGFASLFVQVQLPFSLGSQVQFFFSGSVVLFFAFSSSSPSGPVLRLFCSSGSFSSGPLSLSRGSSSTPSDPVCRLRQVQLFFFLRFSLSCLSGSASLPTRPVPLLPVVQHFFPSGPGFLHSQVCFLHRLVLLFAVRSSFSPSDPDSLLLHVPFFFPLKSSSSSPSDPVVSRLLQLWCLFSLRPSSSSPSCFPFRLTPVSFFLSLKSSFSSASGPVSRLPQVQFLSSLSW